MKSVLISIKPKYCELIANGKKTIEVRKTKPKLETPFKCYIYCTRNKKEIFWRGKMYSYVDDRSHNLFDKSLNGQVLGEFICDKCTNIFALSRFWLDEEVVEKSCFTLNQIRDYSNGSNKLYAWHISDLRIYDKPKELSKFIKCTYPFDCCACDFWDSTYLVCAKPIRTPQSWCYVEELEG